ncbi:regulator of RNase E activity RraA [Chitinophaga niastensis]|uniref:Putative 4-hydroxy-4-methyl-2-oxoglutarate aldolase n=1 Tax=Chitinophaga niastensis TaxID=536980 RepID=A0A2P8HNJ0_CHINA|nr:RraA family protein [Chitinophaga niastensis]PSL47774.1 regulator of RNase E activity RraA [Chitinophaga niastensis]
MIHWKNDTELFIIIKRELYTAVVGDIMDKIGLQQQFLPPRIRPLKEGMFIAGRAMTVLEADVHGEAVDGHNPLLQQPFGLMLDALDGLKLHEVYVCSGASPRYALWGELMSTRALQLGAAGAVVNGYSRDTRGILQVGMPVFSYGPYAQDQAPRGKVVDYRVTIEMEGVLIRPGDIIIGDIDGVCVVPQHAELEVFQQALEKARGEKIVQKQILKGMSAKEAFETYGIL